MIMSNKEIKKLSDAVKELIEEKKALQAATVYYTELTDKIAIPYKLDKDEKSENDCRSEL